MSEQQRVAIVTGAAGGIRRELALGLLGKRLKVAAVDRTVQGLVELAQAAQQRQQGANLMTIEADLARDESIDEIVSKARGHFGMIDILVNNAGVGQATVRSDNPRPSFRVLVQRRRDKRTDVVGCRHWGLPVPAVRRQRSSADSRCPGSLTVVLSCPVSPKRLFQSFT